MMRAVARMVGVGVGLVVAWSGMVAIGTAQRTAVEDETPSAAVCNTAFGWAAEGRETLPTLDPYPLRSSLLERRCMDALDRIFGALPHAGVASAHTSMWSQTWKGDEPCMILDGTSLYWLPYQGPGSCYAQTPGTIDAWINGWYEDDMAGVRVLTEDELIALRELGDWADAYHVRHGY